MQTVVAYQYFGEVEIEIGVNTPEDMERIAEVVAGNPAMIGAIVYEWDGVTPPINIDGVGASIVSMDGNGQVIWRAGEA